MVRITNRMKRLKYIKEGSPKKFKNALKSGVLVPSAEEMNFLEGLGEYSKTKNIDTAINKGIRKCKK